MSCLYWNAITLLTLVVIYEKFLQCIFIVPSQFKNPQNWCIVKFVINTEPSCFSEFQFLIGIPGRPVLTTCGIWDKLGKIKLSAVMFGERGNSKVPIAQVTHTWPVYSLFTLKNLAFHWDSMKSEVFFEWRDYSHVNFILIVDAR